jgi:hypothetical protein
MDRTVVVSVAPEDSKTYRTIPFTVEQECDGIEFRYHVTGGGVIDLGIEREGESRGWSGAERTLVLIEKDSATPGYLPGVEPGEWAVVLGLHTCRPETEITVTIRLIPEVRRWYKGDLHNHSHHSDGRHLLANVFRFAREHHFDFIAVTDHNTVAQNYFAYENQRMLIIPGMELTTYYGHMNYWGVKQPVRDHKVLNQSDLEAKTGEARKGGATVSINHPFKGPSIWEYSYDVDFDSLEVWNGPWSDKNAQAVELWHSLLAHGRKIPAVGGSDSHGSKLAHAINYESSHQIPTTWINSESRSVEGLLRNIRQGHVFITYLPDCPRLEIVDGEGRCLMGETVPGDREIQLIARDLRESDLVRVIGGKGILREFTGLLSYREAFFLNREPFLRLEVHRKTGIILDENPDLIIRGKHTVADDREAYQMAALSNPVYREA